MAATSESIKGAAPLVAIPTTAGTGSEASFGFLIKMNDGRKLTFANPLFLPKLALCDPELNVRTAAVRDGRHRDGRNHALHRGDPRAR